MKEKTQAFFIKAKTRPLKSGKRRRKGRERDKWELGLRKRRRQESFLFCGAKEKKRLEKKKNQKMEKKNSLFLAERKTWKFSQTRLYVSSKKNIPQPYSVTLTILRPLLLKSQPTQCLLSVSPKQHSSTIFSKNIIHVSVAFTLSNSSNYFTASFFMSPSCVCGGEGECLNVSM